MRVVLVYLKTIVLILLIGLTVVQATTLWFDEFSDRNVFYRIIDRLRGGSDIEQVSMAKPYSLAIYFGDIDREYSIIREEAIIVEHMTLASERLLQETLTSKRRIGRVIDEAEIWERQHLRLRFAKPLDVKLFGDSLFVSRSVLEPIKAIDEVIIQTATLEYAHLQVFLHDSISQAYYVYTIDKTDVRELNDNINAFIQDKRGQSYLASYISTQKAGMTIFKNNTLLPLANAALTYYDEIYLYEPYVSEGRIMTSAYEEPNGLSLERYMTRFFTNPDIKSVTRRGDAVVFGDGEVSVSYGLDGYLEMKKILTKSKMPDVMKGYALAYNFVQNDMKESQLDFYYVDHIESKESVIYRFNYKIEGFPIFFDTAWLASYEMNYAIEVEVSNDEVARYRRIVKEREYVIQQPIGFSGNYQDALDYALADVSQDIGALVTMELSYVSVDPNTLQFQWFIQFEDKMMTVPIK